ncbi:hypothetical protein GWI33_011726 [Rhynchophorus ferrugineus]|uniref:Uncharacterized protein n=1 Tax=Rhynchophorus ferrugineus TaxID=354439 RepID=A0A834IPY6_RHYFE|nr:hypothetical protein GWI33_011726 [Rhynchophorus ferrugineus]
MKSREAFRPFWLVFKSVRACLPVPRPMRCSIEINETGSTKAPRPDRLVGTTVPPKAPRTCTSGSVPAQRYDCAALHQAGLDFPFTLGRPNGLLLSPVNRCSARGSNGMKIKRKGELEG